MSRQYLLDGYNIIHQMPVSKGRRLEDARQMLVQFVQHQRPQGSLRNEVTIVFDGQSDIYGSSTSSTIRIIFSQNESADDRILKIVGSAKNKKTLTVVTDDRAVQYAVRALGAQILGVQTFLSQGKAIKLARAAGETKQGIPSGGPGKDIPKTLEFEITSEFEKIWLGKRK